METEIGKPLADIFGDSQLGDHVKGFDFNSSGDSGLHVKLAPAYGSLTSKAMKMMDDNTKVMIATTVEILQKMAPDDRSWDNILSAMDESPLIEADGDGTHRSDDLVKSGSHDFEFDGSPDPNIVQEVRTWFENLINDTDVLASTEIDVDTLGRIVAQTGATVDSIGSFFSKNESHERSVLDIAALRFPDIDNPFFKIFRIQLNAWSRSERTLWHQEDTNGIHGEFHEKRFKPNHEAISKLDADVRQAAVSTADDLFP